MNSDTLDKSRTAPSEPNAETRRRTGHRAALITGAVFLGLALLIAFIVAIWDWNWFRGPLARLASARMHREVTISGDLHVHPFSWNPTASVDGVHVANPPWAGKDRMADIGRIDVRLRLVPLFTGHLDLRRLEFDQPNVRLYRDAQGRATWDLSGKQAPGEPLRLPPIRNFIIGDGHLQVRDDVRKLTFAGTINAHERLGAQTRGFELAGQGVLNSQPFRVDISGGPLLNIDRSRPYPFDAEIHAGATYVTANGQVTKPFDFGHFTMAATARGPDLADVYWLTGIALPNTPPYDLHGNLTRDDHIYHLDDIGGRFGSSDLAGRIEVDSGRPRPLLKADLATHNLYFPDVGAVFGGGPKPGPVASPTQRVEAARLAAESRIFPDTTLDTHRIRSVDADVTYKAATIRNAPINLMSASTHVKLNDGVLRADPVAFDLPQGRIAGFVQLDARKTTPVTDLDLRLSGAKLDQLFPFKFQGGVPFAGGLAGRVRLTGAGESVHRTLANANGRVVMVAPNGEIRSSIAELMGVDVIKGLGLLFGKSQQTTPIRCAVGAFDLKNGVLEANRLVFDTQPVLVTGTGQINLGTERLALRLQGHPKKFQLVRLQVPVDIEGPIRSPQIRLEKGSAIAQGGVAAALATLVSPLALILPFVDPGLAKDANCSALIGDAAQKGAPIKTAPTTHLQTARR